MSLVIYHQMDGSLSPGGILGYLDSHVLVVINIDARLRIFSVNAVMPTVRKLGILLGQN